MVHRARVSVHRQRASRIAFSVFTSQFTHALIFREKTLKYCCLMDSNEDTSVNPFEYHLQKYIPSLIWNWVTYMVCKNSANVTYLQQHLASSYLGTVFENQ